MHPPRDCRRFAVGIAVLTSLSPAMAGSQVPYKHVVPGVSVESLAKASRTGTVVRVSGSTVDTLRRGAADVALSSGEILATVASAESPKVDHATSVPHVDLPGPILAPAAGGDIVRLGVALETNGLFYVPKDDVYIGTVRVGLVDDAQPAATRTLDAKVRVLLGSDGEISPDVLELDHTNLPFLPVVVRARAVQSDSVTVRVRPGFEPNGYAFRVAVHRPRITVAVSPLAISGYGLERAQISVTVPSEAGHGRTVTLLGKLNVPTDGKLTLSGGETGFTKIASRGVGTDTIRVSSPQLADAFVAVRYAFPSGFLVALAMGAILGSVVRAVQRRETRRRRLALGDLLAALAIGTIVAVAYAIGVNFLWIPLPTFGGEAVTLVAAALGSMLGDEVTKRLGQTGAAPATS